MDKLKPVEEVREALGGVPRRTRESWDTETDKILQADREAHADKIDHDVVILFAKHGRPADSVLVMGISKTIHAVAAPPETERERLGRVLWEALHPSIDTGIPWCDLDQPTIDKYCTTAATITAEQAKIKEEARG